MSDAEVHYCYMCGRPVGPSAGKCLFCGSPTRRQIRPPRRCPYCDEPVRPRAIKCHHCGEFLDGRKEKVAAEAPKGGPTFVIDKAIIQTNESGQPELRPLDASRGIAAPDQKLIEGPRERSAQPKGHLPAPESQSRKSAKEMGTIEIELEPQSSAQGSASSESAGREVAVRQATTPGREFAAASATAGRELARAAGHAAAQLPALWKGFQRSRQRRKDRAVDIEIEGDPYRLCNVCGTEIFKADNFCFHCGQRHSTEKPAKPIPLNPPNVAHYFVIAAALVGYAMATTLLKQVAQETLIAPAQVATAAIAVVVAIWALARKPGVVPKAIPFAVLIVTFVVLILFYGN